MGQRPGEFRLDVPAGDDASPRVRPERLVAPLLAVLAVVLVAQQTRVVFGVLAKFTNVDQVILWAAARDWGRFVVHQPNYYGQDYGTTFEGIPIELVHVLDVRLSAAVPLVLAALTVSSWFLLAGVAWKRRQGLLAVFTLAGPLLMSSYYAFYTTFYGAATGRFLVVLGTSLVLLAGRRLVPFAGGWALITFGVAIDPSAVILGVPVLVFLLFDRVWIRSGVLAATFASLPAVAWLVATKIFYRAHPDYVVFRVGVHPSVLGVKRNLAHPSRLWGMFSPDLLRQWWILPMVIAVLVGSLVATRRLRVAAPALALILVLAVATTMELAGPATLRSVLLPESRIMLALPFGVWFLALLVSEHYAISRRHARVALVGVTALALVTAGVRFVDFHERLDSIAAASTHQLLIDGLVPANGVERECAAGLRFARAVRAGLVVYDDDILTYACAGMHGQPETLNDLIERRTWRLTEEQSRRRDRLLLWGPPAGTCTTARQRLNQCQMLRLGHVQVALVRFPPESSIAALKRLGIVVRGFGPGCHPVVRPGQQPLLGCR